MVNWVPSICPGCLEGLDELTWVGVGIVGDAVRKGQEREKESKEVRNGVIPRTLSAQLSLQHPPFPSCVSRLNLPILSSVLAPAV